MSLLLHDGRLHLSRYRLLLIVDYLSMKKKGPLKTAFVELVKGLVRSEGFSKLFLFDSFEGMLIVFDHSLMISFALIAIA